jgi:hypothetical protein
MIPLALAIPVFKMINFVRQTNPINRGENYRSLPECFGRTTGASHNTECKLAFHSIAGCAIPSRFHRRTRMVLTRVFLLVQVREWEF